MAAITSKLPQNLGKNKYRDISACKRVLNLEIHSITFITVKPVRLDYLLMRTPLYIGHYSEICIIRPPLNKTTSLYRPLQ